MSYSLTWTTLCLEHHIKTTRSGDRVSKSSTKERWFIGKSTIDEERRGSTSRLWPSSCVGWRSRLASRFGEEWLGSQLMTMKAKELTWSTRTWRPTIALFSCSKRLSALSFWFPWFFSTVSSWVRQRRRMWWSMSKRRLDWCVQPLVGASCSFWLHHSTL